MVGLDASATLLEHTRRRLGDRAELHPHDTEKPLTFLDDAPFDGVLCAPEEHHRPPPDPAPSPTAHWTPCVPPTA